MKILVAWLGGTDIRGAQANENHMGGPIGRALHADKYDQLILLSQQPEDDLAVFLGWLQIWCSVTVDAVPISMDDPTNLREIYLAATTVLDERLTGKLAKADLTFHLSPGTPSMAAIWILLASTRYPARTIQSSEEQDVVEAEIPFEISAEFIPKIMEAADLKLQIDIGEIPKEGATFGDIIYKSSSMAEVVELAKRSAIRSIPVIIDGETGTGKELLARAIHQASSRSKGPFVPINCGAIPPDLFESELFGSSRGAFTGAIDRPGHFENATDGTLFLDEIGELERAAQVKLLRALEQSEVTRVGESTPRQVNVRVIAASHMNIIQCVRDGQFREDLLYRLLGIMLTLPPLRSRPGDVSLLADRLLDKINDESEISEVGYVRKTLSAGARNVLIKHQWPGNVRELQGTLRRAALWTEGSKISKSAIEYWMIPSIEPPDALSGIANRSFGPKFKIDEVRDEITRHYLARALEEANGNKSKAARLLGVTNYQTISNWIVKFNQQQT